MGADAVIYGAIDGPYPIPDAARWRRMNRHNRVVLRRLPGVDAYPPLARGMFGVTDRVGLRWKTSVIHFGWSTRNFAGEWPEWRAKFEGLLRKLYWTTARVHVEAEYDGDLACQWVILPEVIGRWVTDPVPTPGGGWEFFPRGELAGGC